MKKFISLFLVVTMLLSVCILPTYAIQVDGSMDQFVRARIPDLVSHISANPERYELTSSDMANAYVSSSFTIDGSAENTFYYAIVNEEKVLGVISVCQIGNKYSMSYAKDFADILTTGLTSNGGFELEWIDNNLNVRSNETTLTSQTSTAITGNNLDIVTALKTVFYNVDSISTTYATTNSNLSGELEGDFPLVWQFDQVEGDRNCSCAVACGKAIAQYFDSSLSSKTILDVINDVYPELGKTWIPCLTTGFDPYVKVPEIFDYYLDNSYLKFSSPFTLTGLKNQIDSNNPILCLSYVTTYPENYHGTVITGYSYGSVSQSYMISMMDPLNPSWRTVFWDGTGDLSYTISSNTVVWQKSIVVYS